MLVGEKKEWLTRTYKEQSSHGFLLNNPVKSLTLDDQSRTVGLSHTTPGLSKLIVSF